MLILSHTTRLFVLFSLILGFSSCYPTKNFTALDLAYLPETKGKTVAIIYETNRPNSTFSGTEYKWIEREIEKALHNRGYKIVTDRTVRIYGYDELYNVEKVRQHSRTWIDAPLSQQLEVDYFLVVSCRCNVRFATNLQLDLIEANTGVLEWVGDLGEHNRTYRIDKILPIIQVEI